MSTRSKHARGVGGALAIAAAGVVTLALGVMGLVLQFPAADGGSVQFAAVGLSACVAGLILVLAADLKRRESVLDESPYVVPLVVVGGVLALPVVLILGVL